MVETKAHTVELSFIQYQQIQMKSSCMCFIATRNDLKRPQEKTARMYKLTWQTVIESFVRSVP